MARTIPAVYAAPGLAFASPVLSTEEKVILATVLTYTDPLAGACRLLVPEIAGACGMKPKPARQALNSLIEKGWIEEIPNGQTSYRVNFVAAIPEKVEEKKPDKEIFDKGNLVMDEKEINHLIKVFLDSGLNPKLKGKTAEANSYRSPYQRRGARMLVSDYSMAKTEKMIEDLKVCTGDIYCPKIDSLHMLHSKWDKCVNFLRIKESSGIGQVY